MKRHSTSSRFLHALIAAGYLLMCLLAVGIMYLWLHEWLELEKLEAENQRINAFRQEVHHVYGEMTGLSFLGESVLEWEQEDLNKRIAERVPIIAARSAQEQPKPTATTTMLHTLNRKEIAQQAKRQKEDE